MCLRAGACMCVCVCTVCANVSKAINYSINRSPRALGENKSAQSRETWAPTSFSLIGFRLDEHLEETLLRQNEEFRMGWNIIPGELWASRCFFFFYSLFISWTLQHVFAASITQTFNVEHASNNDTRSLEDEQRFVQLFEFSAASRTKLHKHSVYSSVWHVQPAVQGCFAISQMWALLRRMSPPHVCSCCWFIHHTMNRSGESLLRWSYGSAYLM